MRRRRAGVLILVIMFVSGCATLFASKRTTVSFNSNPVGAAVMIDGNRVGATPMTLELENSRNYTVVFRLEGREEVSCLINKKIGAGWVILDVLGGLLPVVIDAATGAWYGLDKNACAVTLP